MHKSNKLNNNKSFQIFSSVLSVNVLWHMAPGLITLKLLQNTQNKMPICCYMPLINWADNLQSQRRVYWVEVLTANNYQLFCLDQLLIMTANHAYC